MRFNIAILLCLILEISSSSVEETLSPYSVIDYRIPLKHPQLMSAVNPQAAASYYLGRLGVDYPMNDLDSVYTTPLYEKWTREFTIWKLYSINPYACELTKTRLGQLEFKYYDSVSDYGKVSCYNQCFATNEEFYKFLSMKLTELTWKNPLIDVALNAPTNFFGQKKISECVRLAEKRYECACHYRNYMIKVGPDFERLFGKILLEVRGMTAPVTGNREELEEKYGIPMKLMGFLIVYHLLPDDMFTYLVWWAVSE